MSFGEELKRERELREISLREVSEATKISLRYLEALERNDFKGLPGGVFNRGFVRAYSQFIGVDPESMVDAYMLQEKVSRGPDGEQAPGSAGPAPDAKRYLWVWWVVGALAVVAVSYLGWTYFKAAPESPAPISVPDDTNGAETTP